VGKYDHIAVRVETKEKLIKLIDSCERKSSQMDMLDYLINEELKRKGE
jgi:hypothetical protein